jgi:lipoprotein-releasing system permease protein
LQKKLLGAQAHIALVPKGRAGIADYMRITKEVEQVPGVVLAAPAVFQTVLISTEVQNKGVVLKGILPEMESRMSALSENMVEGSLNEFTDNSIIMGKELASALGTFKGDRVQIVSAETSLTPLGGLPKRRSFQVTGLFSSGLYDYDTSWVYVPIAAAQRLQGLNDVASTIEVKISDIYQARVIGQRIIDRVGLDDNESIYFSGSSP